MPGIDWNIDEQIALLSKMSFAEELAETPLDKPDHLGFYLNNDSFGPGDAEIWYQMIRLKKPRRIFEVGSGNSTSLGDYLGAQLPAPPSL